MDWKKIQTALNERGFNAGPIDGQPGRMTIAAVKAFQEAESLDIQFPGTVGPKTLAAFFGGPAASIKNDAVIPPWVAELRRRIGLHEVRDNKKLREWLKSDGDTLGDPAQLPWCGDAMETAIYLTLPNEPGIDNPYWALNWTKFGVPIDIVALGAMAPFKRDGGGHIGTVAGHDKTHYHILGGNQTNQLSIVKIEKKRLSGKLRWPSTYPLPTVELPFTSLDATISTNEA